MSNPIEIKDKVLYKLFLFTFFIALTTYGFAFTNFTVSVDNEMPILSDYGMDLGRWGHNLILYHLLGGHLQYFSLFLSLLLYSVAAVKINSLFKFQDLTSYIFCGLFVNFPQLSYQVVFGMMSVIAALSVLLSTFSLELFIKGYNIKPLWKKTAFFSATALIIMFTLAMYQAFIFIPVTLYLILFFQSTFDEEFKIGIQIKKLFVFSVIILVSGLLYYLSIKIICPLPKGGYVESFVSKGDTNFFENFITISKANLTGNFYYGESLYLLASLLIIILTVKFFISKELFIYRFIALLVLILSPFTLSFFITNGYHPPRLYLTSNLIFAFVLVFSINHFRLNLFKATSMIIILVFIVNVFFITNLFNSANKIYKHDKRIAEKIDNIIQTKYPSFTTSDKTVYFYGYFPYEYHQKFRLDNSEIFGGSFYNWDNGSNYRLINFFKEADVAEYNMITREKFDYVKDSIDKMPSWPDYESIKLINNTIIVKLGNIKGEQLYFE